MSLHSLVAHFLHANNYHETLRQFEAEHGNPIPLELPAHESLEEIVNDRYTFNEVAGLQHLDINEILDEQLQQVARGLGNWTSPYPVIKHRLDGSLGLVVSAQFVGSVLLLATADTKLVAVDLDGNKTGEWANYIGRVVIKKIVRVDDGRAVLIGMNGSAHLVQVQPDSISTIWEGKVHQRLVTDAKVVAVGDKQYLVTLGWDFLVRVFTVTEELTQVAETRLLVQGSAFDAIEYQGKLVVVVGKNEHTLLEVYTLDGGLELIHKISLNDAEFTTLDFSPRAIQILAGATPLVAVGTSHEPYMRLIVVALTDLQPGGVKRNQILKNLNTLCPQDKYSTAMIAWREDGSGVWALGEDGILRGMDLVHEKAVVEVPAHTGKIKTFAAGQGLATCGADRAVVLWSK